MKYFKGRDWNTQHEILENGWTVVMPANTSIVLQDQAFDGYDYSYTPYIRGGSINYWVRMTDMDCGCVAGVYLVALSAGCDVESAHNGDPNCPAIDVMQTNPYGFDVAAHPCANGDCSAQSMCDYQMRNQGAEKYGMDAFGPGGTMIDTTYWFKVQTDFVSKNNYSDLYKIRTTIYQGSDVIEMEADCGEYLDPLSYDIEGHMAFVVSNWDNRDGREDFERGDAPSPTNDCSVGSWEFSEFNVWQYGYNEEQEDNTPDPDP